MDTIDLITPHSRQVAGLRRLLGVCAASLTDCGSVANPPTDPSGAAPCSDDSVPPGLLAYETAIERMIATMAEPANRQIAMTAIHICIRTDWSRGVRISEKHDREWRGRLYGGVHATRTRSDGR